MNVDSFLLGRPPAAVARGGDCRARDLDQGRNVGGPHRVADPTHLRIGNGIIRLTVGAAGAAPGLAVEQYTGGVVSGDVYHDVYHDLYGGIESAPGWTAMGTLTIDSPAVSALFTAARLVRVNEETVTIRLLAPLIGDAYVTLRRGHRAVTVQHGSTRPPIVALARRVRWTGPPAITGTAAGNRVQEDTPTVAGFRRFVAGFRAVTANAGAFSVTSASAGHAMFGAGVANLSRRNAPADLHAQLGDTSRGGIEVEAA